MLGYPLGGILKIRTGYKLPGRPIFPVFADAITLTRARSARITLLILKIAKKVITPRSFLTFVTGTADKVNGEPYLHFN